MFVRIAELRQITYAIDPDTGLCISRFGDRSAWPILNWEDMLPENNFATSYYLEDDSIFDCLPRVWRGLHWTRRIPVAIKNIHREFWGFKLLKEE